MTVTAFARAAGLSRGTVLYYESIGLIRPSARTASNYRVYGEPELRKLRQIRAYRSAGLTIEDIRSILSQRNTDFAAVLRRRLAAVGEEIARLREHQRGIGQLLQATGKVRRDKMITKQKWVEIMQASGFSEQDMRRWHAQFEKSAPEEHDEFLHFLHIPEDEIRSIREWSRQPQ